MDRNNELSFESIFEFRESKTDYLIEISTGWNYENHKTYELDHKEAKALAHWLLEIVNRESQ